MGSAVLARSLYPERLVDKHPDLRRSHSDRAQDLVSLADATEPGPTMEKPVPWRCYGSK